MGASRLQNGQPNLVIRHESGKRMGKHYEELSARHMQFIAEQKIFFVGTATTDSRVNVSPKGMDSLRVLGSKRVVWLNLTGSGNETSAHVQVSPRMTIMFCAFDGDPLILRLYGKARVIHKNDAAWSDLFPHFGPLPGARQIFELSVELVQTSCGFGVPYYSYEGDRELLKAWAIRKGEEGLKRYWEEKNQTSLDTIPTRIMKRNT
jgi:hypothetical protein